MNFPTFSWLNKILFSFVRLKSPIRLDGEADVTEVYSIDQIVNILKNLKTKEPSQYLIHVDHIPHYTGDPRHLINFLLCSKLGKPLKVEYWYRKETQKILIKVTLL